MKITYFLVSSSFLTILIAPLGLAADEDTSDTCSQVIQFAVSVTGQCEAFPTPCDVPEDWKPISSCDLIDTEEEGLSFEEKAEQRRNALFRGFARKRHQQVIRQARDDKKNNINIPKIARTGRASLTKTGEYRKRQRKELEVDTYKRTRGYTEPNFDNKDAYRIAKEVNQNRGGYQRGLTPGQKYQQNFLTKGRQDIGLRLSTTGAKREGPLKSLYNRRGIRAFSQKDFSKEDAVRKIWEKPEPPMLKRRRALKEERKNKVRDYTYGQFQKNAEERRNFGFGQDSLLDD